MAKSNKPVVQAAPPAPVVLFLAIGPKRGLTGTGKGAYDNKATMDAFMALPGARDKGLPLAEFAKCAADRGHKGFTSYAVKYHWLVQAPAPGSVLAVGPV